MVSQKVNIKDKRRGLKKFLKVLILIVVIVITVVVIYFAYLGFSSSNPENKIVLENPLNTIILGYATGDDGGIIELTLEEEEELIQEAVLEFDADYINYLLLALGVEGLHKSPTFENPKIEIDVGEVWGSEINKGSPNTQRGGIEGKDIRFIMTKEEAVKALLSNDAEDFMKNSVSSGRTQIEMVAGRVELFTKGYLGLYKDLTGDEALI
tara:strand:- start:303 stop:932 length:630 start_codon:yes stop_codon:yes gene_type:complete